jgi:hypothetical protein
VKAKDKVLLVYPKARAERQKTHTGSYWLVREHWNASMYLASGDTEAQASRNAASSLPSDVESRQRASLLSASHR